MPRIALIRQADGIVAPNSTIELMRDIGRPRGDMYEFGLWEDILTVEGTELFYTYTVDNQAIVIPETSTRSARCPEPSPTPPYPSAAPMKPWVYDKISSHHPRHGQGKTPPA